MKNKTPTTRELVDNTYIDSALRGLKRLLDDDFRDGKISETEYKKRSDKFTEAINAPE